MRLLNYNVEAQCTPSRAALMTGRYAVRTGNGSVPLETANYGLTQWEYTMPEMLGDVGYATAMFGKWHLGQAEGRYPTNQGFDEWYGIPNSTDESLWPAQEMFQKYRKLAEKTGKNPMIKEEHIYSARKGSPAKVVKVYDVPARREIDREITDHAKDFMTRQAKAGKPFFLYLPYTQTHMPVLPSKEFKGKSGNGRWGDVLMQIDAYTGELLDKVDELGIADNTVFIFTSDNGGEMTPVTRDGAAHGVVPISRVRKGRYGCRLLSAGLAKFRQARSLTRSFTSLICTLHWQTLPVVKCRQIVSSTVRT